MPRQNIAAENVRNDSADRFPRLKLETNEIAIFCLFQQPWMEWVHELRAIKIEGGVAQKETKTRKDKTTYEDYKYEFVGRPICLGDSSVLQDKGVDKDNCPACADGMSPVQRYAANIIKYALNGQGEPRDPFGADILVWSFTARMFGELFQLQKGTQAGDLSMVDLRLFCEDGHWQRNKLYIHSQTAWCRQEKNFGQVSALLQTPGNLATDEQLAEQCGRRRSRDQIQLDLDRIAGAARQAAQAGSMSQQSLTANLDSIMPGGAQQTPGQNPGWTGLPQQVPQTQPQMAMAGAQQAAPATSASDPFAAMGLSGQAPVNPREPVQGTQEPVPGSRPEEIRNPGVGGWAEFAPVQAEPAGQPQAVADQAAQMFPQGQAAPATEPAEAAPAAAEPAGVNFSFSDVMNRKPTE